MRDLFHKGHRGDINRFSCWAFSPNAHALLGKTMRQPVTTIDIRRDLVGLLPRLRRFAMTLGGDTTSTDELVQAVCRRAIEKSNQWNGEGRLESWVYTLARQQWTDDNRRRKPHVAPAANITDIREASRDR